MSNAILCYKLIQIRVMYSLQWRRHALVRGHETERKQFKGDTKKYYHIHAISSDSRSGADVAEYAEYAMLSFTR